MKKFEYQLIICIVNEGFSDAVMDAAKEVGARGGTIIKAHGTANKEAEKFFNIEVQAEKEMVMIIVKDEIKDTVLHALYQSVGLNSAGKGIAFALPIDNVVGLTKANEHFLHETKEQPKEEPEENKDNKEE